MSFEDIVYLINLIDKSHISLMELNYEKVYLKLDKSMDRRIASEKATDCANDENSINRSVVNANHNVDEKSIQIEKTENLDVDEYQDDGFDFGYILSPMVGTVYLAPSPGKQTYVCQHQSVNKGDVVCIIEAMKLMNEIESEYSGEIVEVLVKDSQMVEYGQKLFKVKYN